MAPKRTAPSDGEQKQDPKAVKQLRRSSRLGKNAAAAAAAAAAAPKEDAKPQKRARKTSPKPKKQSKEKITKEEAASAQNGETKAEKIHVSRSSVSVTSARSIPPSSLSVKGQIKHVTVKGTEN
ncbi:high mobility group nucleosome-binding domain-containing protein 3 isoform X1 [Hemitrygon akajei]|uniref:high mobility group nucleosome-binding domain-containing protein 3 isoform X1 n=1 Tax=Hemitrygon akajei TaxID=2704970 RepID=UPI003BFA217A